MIEVKIRDTSEAYGETYGEFLPSELDAIVQLVKQHGSFTDVGKGEFLSASFVSDDQISIKGWFEIIVETNEK